MLQILATGAQLLRRTVGDAEIHRTERAFFDARDFAESALDVLASFPKKTTVCSCTGHQDLGKPDQF